MNKKEPEPSIPKHPLDKTSRLTGLDGTTSVLKETGTEFFFWCERRYKLVAILVLILLLIPSVLILEEKAQPYMYYVKSYIFGVVAYSLLMSIFGFIFVVMALKKKRFKKAISIMISLSIVSIPWAGMIVSYEQFLR